MEQYRSKGAIGFIVPPRCNETVLEEAFRLRPPGLTWCFASLGLSEFGEQPTSCSGIPTRATVVARGDGPINKSR